MLKEAMALVPEALLDEWKWICARRLSAREPDLLAELLMATGAGSTMEADPVQVIDLCLRELEAEQRRS